MNYLKPDVLAITDNVNPDKIKDYTSKYWKLKRFKDKLLPSYSTTAIITKILEKHK